MTGIGPGEPVRMALAQTGKVRFRRRSPILSDHDDGCRRRLSGMPRRREVPKRETLPDPIYSSTLVTKFVNCMMVQGKKSVAEHIFYGALDMIKDRTKEDPVKIFKKGLEAVKPVLEVKSRRVGGATYQVPIEVPPDRRTSLAIRWIISNARSRGEKTMREKLA